MRERLRNEKGDFIKMPRPTLKQRFYANTTMPDDNGCMLWVAGRSGKDSYGQICDYLKKPRSVYAHRFSYELHYGSFDKKLHVLHKCDNPPCVAPEHLFLGTPRDNSEDKIKKGRAKNSQPRYGELNPAAKFCNEDIIKIKGLLNSGEKISDIAATYNVSRQTIGSIKNNRRWSDVK